MWTDDRPQQTDIIRHQTDKCTSILYSLEGAESKKRVIYIEEGQQQQQQQQLQVQVQIKVQI